MPTKDAGGRITASATPIVADAQVQVTRATDGMRADAGFIQGDVRVIVLAAGLARKVDRSATVNVLAGPHLGSYSLETESADSVMLAFDGRGRRL